MITVLFALLVASFLGALGYSAACIAALLEGNQDAFEVATSRSHQFAAAALFLSIAVSFGGL